MENDKTYLSRETKDREKLMELLDILPPYCSSFFMSTQGLLPKTRLEYAKDLKTFFLFIKQQNPLYKESEIKDIPCAVLNELEPDDIDEFLLWLEDYQNDKGRQHNANVTKSRKLACLKTFYKFLVKRHYVKNNPTVIIETPYTSKERNIITFEQEQKVELLEKIESGDFEMTKKQKEIHEKVKYRDYAIFMTFFGTGMRISELTGIDLDDLDLEDGSLYIHRKGNVNDVVYFGDEVADALRTYLEKGRHLLNPEPGEKALFLSRRGTRATDRTIELRLDFYTDALFGKNNKFTVHKCRATFGTQLYEETGDIYLVAEVLGHKDIATTRKHYAKMAQLQKRRVRQMDIRR